MNFKRHYLLEISEKGRKYSYDFIKSYQKKPLSHVKKLLVDGYKSILVPGVIRREEEKIIPGTVAVGFSSPNLFEGKRLKIATFTPINEIKHIITPYEIAKKSFKPRTKCLKALKEINTVASRNNINLGVWGSAGLEIYTGLPYTKDSSDLDLLISATDLKTIKIFYRTIIDVGYKYNTLIDLELDLPNGYGVKVGELFLNIEQVLCKNIFEVRLINKYLILELLNYI